MAYDWSGNKVKEKRDDWVIIVALAALALFITAMPLVMMLGTPQASLIQAKTSEIGPAPLKT